MAQMLAATVSGFTIDILKVTTHLTLAINAIITRQDTDVANQDRFRQCLCIRSKRSFFAADEEEILS
jgi:hypothetical protein